MNWLKEIEAATSVDAVIELVNDYVAEQGEGFWGLVPRGARPGEALGEDDVHLWHHRIVHELGQVKSASEQLQDLCVVFLRASVRIHQINLRNGDVGPSSNDEVSLAPARGRNRSA